MPRLRFALYLCPLALFGSSSGQNSNNSGLLTGQKTYQESCSMCHGADAKGGMGPSLRGKLKHGSDRAAILSVIKNGVPGTAMPAMGDLPAASLNHVTDYILSLQKSGK